MIGGLLRVLAIYLFDDIQTQFIVLFIGQSITAVAQAFILIQPTKLAAYWFAPDERTIANAAGTIGSKPSLIYFVVCLNSNLDYEERQSFFEYLFQAFEGKSTWFIVINNN